MGFWSRLVGIILRNRIAILVGFVFITIFMGYKAQFAKMIYEFPDLLPDSDTSKIAYVDFQKRFGKSGSVLMVALEENPLENKDHFNGLFQLVQDLKAIKGVDTVVSVTSIFDVVKNAEEKRFDIERLITQPVSSDQQLDSIKNRIYQLPFYKGLLYNDSTGVSLIAITLDKEIFGSKQRVPLIEAIENRVQLFKEEQATTVHLSGLPYIRTVVTEMIRKELRLFILLSIFITTLLLSIFFRSVKTVFTSMVVVGIGVVWYFGLLTLLDYRITILTALIPPLLIVIGVPNCIFLINKYHSEFKNHGNKIKALGQVIEKIGNATFLTNVTTASGFFTFVFTRNPLLIEFGIVAFISIMFIFLIAITIVPILFSYYPVPKTRHSKHLNKTWIISSVKFFEHLVINYRNAIYAFTIALIGCCIYGVTLLKTTGNIVDDVPKSHHVVQDLKFFETHFRGVMPFEISINAKKEGYAAKQHTLKKIDKLYKLLAGYSEFSRPLSIIDGLKFCKQAYYNGDERKFQLITNQEQVFFKPYLENANGNQQWLSSFIDSTKQYTRISVQMQDIGTQEMDALFEKLYPEINSIFNPKKYKVDIVGPSIIFLRGTTFLISNLKTSLVIAIVFIAIIMALLFYSWRMVLVSLVPNLIPLLVTAAIMGYFGIALKPSTILVFSIAFGISVDDTIHFLAKYRQELKHNSWDIKISVLRALKETGISMIYTSIILFFGFAIFMISDFGGTQSLGILISVTLLVAMLSNLILLPAFLLTLDKIITTKAFKEPLLEIFDEEVDIDHEFLTIAKDPALNNKQEKQ